MSEWETWGRAGRTEPDDACELRQTLPALPGEQR